MTQAFTNTAGATPASATVVSLDCLLFMKPELRYVSQMPLHELWDERGVIVSADRVRQLSSSGIAGLLHSGRVRFVVADIGSRLQWIALEECYRFWKSEAKSHIAEPDSQSRLEDFPDEYLYIASEWKATKGGEPIVLLAKSH